MSAENIKGAIKSRSLGVRTEGGDERNKNRVETGEQDSLEKGGKHKKIQKLEEKQG